MTVNNRDLLASLMFVGIGAYFAITAYLELSLGIARRMGPGYFPVLVGGLLVGLGLIGAARAIKTAPIPISAVPWRGILLNCAALIAFGLMVRVTGLVPSLVVSTLLSAFSSRRMTWKIALLLTFILTAICVVVFSYLLNLSLPLVGASAAR